MNTLLAPLVSSTTRVQLLIRFFSNPNASSYLRSLATEFSISPNAVREELSRLAQAQLLTSSKEGREVHFRANKQHPLFCELVSIVQKVLGIDKVIANIIEQVGDLKLALLMDDYAQGRDTGIIDLVLVGVVDAKRLAEMVEKTEGYIKRKIRVLALNGEEYQRLSPMLQKRPHLVLWQENGLVKQGETG